MIAILSSPSDSWAQVPQPTPSTTPSITLSLVLAPTAEPSATATPTQPPMSSLTCQQCLWDYAQSYPAQLFYSGHYTYSDLEPWAQHARACCMQCAIERDEEAIAALWRLFVTDRESFQCIGGQIAALP